MSASSVCDAERPPKVWNWPLTLTKAGIQRGAGVAAEAFGADHTSVERSRTRTSESVPVESCPP